MSFPAHPPKSSLTAPETDPVAHLSAPTLATRRKTTEAGIALVQTRFVMLVQPDLPFLRAPHLYYLLRSMETLPDLAYVRFNRAPNQRSKFDYWISHNVPAKSWVPLCRTPVFSSENHLVPASVYRKYCTAEGWCGLQGSHDGTVYACVCSMTSAACVCLCASVHLLPSVALSPCLRACMNPCVGACCFLGSFPRVFFFLSLWASWVLFCVRAHARLRLHFCLSACVCVC